MRIQTSEHLRSDLVGDTPGHRELLGGRESVLYLIGAISEESTGYTTEEERLQCADKRPQASRGRLEGTVSHAFEPNAGGGCTATSRQN